MRLVSFVRPLTYDEIKPSFREIQFCYSKYGLHDLDVDSLVARVGKGNHGGDKLDFESILVHNGGGVLVISLD